MLTPERYQKSLSNIAFQKDSPALLQADDFIGQDQYKDLMVSVFEYCESLNLSSQTSYLAKIYLDIVFNKSNFIEANQVSLISLCCIWMAIKFNEHNQVSSYFNAQVVCQHGEQSFSVDELLAMEFHVLGLLQYKLSYTTPYDYIQPFFQSFPWMRKAKGVIRSIIQISGGILKIRNDSSRDIFYAAFQGMLQLKKCILGPMQKNVLASQIKDAPRIQALSSIILQRYNQIVQSYEKMEDEQESQQTLDQ